MNQELVNDLALDLIKSGIGLVNYPETKYSKDCRELMNMFNETPIRPEAEIKAMIVTALANKQIKPNETDVINIMARIKKLYIDDYM